METLFTEMFYILKKIHISNSQKGFKIMNAVVYMRPERLATVVLNDPLKIRTKFITIK